MSPFEVRDLSPAFGSEIECFEFHGEVDEATRRKLRETFDARGLLLFRDLDIDRTAQAYLSELVITDQPLSMDDAAEIAGKQDGFWISNREPGAAAPFGRLLFHCDMMWSDDPFQVLSLYGVEIEPPVVPTMFVSAAHAWDTLPSNLRGRAANLRALHVTGPEGFDDRRRGLQDGDLVNPVREQTLSNTTEIGLRHPRTGHMLMYVSQGMTKEIVGLPIDESESLLDELFEHLYSPANLWQHEWHNGDLVIWDNLAVQHARSAVAIDGPARTLRKIGSPIPTVTEVPTYQPIAAR
jgi:taurine dioxygenase